MGGCLAVRVAPYVEDRKRNIEEYTTRVSNNIIHSLGKCRFSLLNSDHISTMAINTEGLIDFVLVSLGTVLITTETDFRRHFRLCCVLANHSCTIITRLSQKQEQIHQVQQQDQQGQEQGGNKLHGENTKKKRNRKDNISVSANPSEQLPSPFEDSHQICRDNKSDVSQQFEDLYMRALTVFHHPLLNWSDIVTGNIPDDETTSQMFCLFRSYCLTLANYFRHCSATATLPPQTLYRTKYQNYDPNFRFPAAYEHDYQKLDTYMNKIIDLCNKAIEELHLEQSLSHPEMENVVPIRPLQVGSHSRRKRPSLTPIEE